MEIHYKTSVWRKIIIPEHITKEQIITLLSKNFNNVNDLFDNFPGELEDEIMEETEELLYPENNNGQATVEIIEFDCKNQKSTIVWSNN